MFQDLLKDYVEFRRIIVDKLFVNVHEYEDDLVIKESQALLKKRKIKLFEKILD